MGHRPILLHALHPTLLLTLLVAAPAITITREPSTHGDRRVRAQTLHARDAHAARGEAEGAVAIVYLNWGTEQLPDYTIASALTALYFHPGSPVYLLTEAAQDAEQMIQKMRGSCGADISLSRLHVVQLSSFRDQSEQERLFDSQYIPCSVNGYNYEKTCFQRYFWLKAWMSSAKIKHVLALDSDILLFGNVLDHFSIDTAAPLFTINRWSSFFTYFSLQVLSDFCDYMVMFYSRPPLDIFSDVAAYGDPRWVPKPVGWQFASPPKQFSDMMLWSAFLHGRADLLPLVKYPSMPMTDMSQVAPVDQVLLNSKLAIGTCGPTNGWSNETVGGRSLRIPHLHGTRMIGSHYQSTECKQLVRASYVKMGLPCL